MTSQPEPAGGNGEGANLAPRDGAELGKAIAAHPDDAEAALTEHEQAMFARSAEAAVERDELHELMFGAGAPHDLVAAFTDLERTP
ncbi:hypothetical protein [Saccharopolyspora sp. NFXS83]|uniref:hypothetical protein n=1 Tax=Saccharopolyspora sp. NFXS83 TaxID=2993560 RepID=UPI002B05246C|nr:hypothetical protein [Saccharopolyspora sp. NFXS83]